MIIFFNETNIERKLDKIMSQLDDLRADEVQLKQAISDAMVRVQNALNDLANQAPDLTSDIQAIKDDIASVQAIGQPVQPAPAPAPAPAPEPAPEPAPAPAPEQAPQ